MKCNFLLIVTTFCIFSNRAFSHVTYLNPLVETLNQRTVSAINTLEEIKKKYAQSNSENEKVIADRASEVIQYIRKSIIDLNTILMSTVNSNSKNSNIDKIQKRVTEIADFLSRVSRSQRMSEVMGDTSQNTAYNDYKLILSTTVVALDYLLAEVKNQYGNQLKYDSSFIFVVDGMELGSGARIGEMPFFEYVKKYQSETPFHPVPLKSMFELERNLKNLLESSVSEAPFIENPFASEVLYIEKEDAVDMYEGAGSEYARKSRLRNLTDIGLYAEARGNFEFVMYFKERGRNGMLLYNSMETHGISVNFIDYLVDAKTGNLYLRKDAGLKLRLHGLWQKTTEDGLVVRSSYGTKDIAIPFRREMFEIVNGVAMLREGSVIVEEYLAPLGGRKISGRFNYKNGVLTYFQNSAETLTSGLSNREFVDTEVLKIKIQVDPRMQKFGKFSIEAIVDHDRSDFPKTTYHSETVAEPYLYEPLTVRTDRLLNTLLVRGRAFNKGDYRTVPEDLSFYTPLIGLTQNRRDRDLPRESFTDKIISFDFVKKQLLCSKLIFSAK